MKVLHVISGISRQSGGPSRSSQGLAAAERVEGVDASIYPFDGAEPWIDGVVVFRPSGQGLSVQDIKQFDVVHVHGIWDPHLHGVCVMCRECGVPYIVAPRGMLEPWSLKTKWLKKRIARFLYQDRDLKKAAALHATAESEAEQFRRLGFRQPIIISPNGVDIPGEMPPRAHRADGRKTILFLSRVHPKKGLLELIEAWGKVKGGGAGDRGRETKQRQSAEAVGSEGNGRREAGDGRRGERSGSRQWQSAVAVGSEGERGEKWTGTNELLDWHVEYAGPDYGGHLHAVQKRIKELGVESDFTYLGDLNDLEKWSAYRRADIFVLPTYSENFGIVVAEALAAGVPVITTRGAPWSELEGTYGDTVAASRRVKAECGRCGWWIDIGVEPLAEALKEAMRLSDEERRTMGENGRRLVEAKYTWPAIAEQMKAAYEHVLQISSQPLCNCFVSDRTEQTPDIGWYEPTKGGKL